MPLLQLDDISLAFGERQLLDAVQLVIQNGERVCLIGRNGEGKSTLMKVIMGSVSPDNGRVWLRPGFRIGVLQQDNSVPDNMTVWENVIEGLPDHQDLLNRYYSQLDVLADDNSEPQIDLLAAIEVELDSAGAWESKRLIEDLLSRLELDPKAQLADLSGGWRRRAMLAKALIHKPDLLLLDEPTNHLDIAAITWLESFMLDFQGALLFVSHDRAFSKRLATRVIELDRGRLTSWNGGIDHYLKRKSEALANEAKVNAEFDKRLQKEEVWIRQGIKARRTRNEGRVRSLEAMRNEHKLRRERLQGASMKLNSADLSGKIVVDTMDAAAGYGEVNVLKGVTVRILRGDRIGIIGPNGSGKSTLLRLLLGEIEPQQGSVQRGTRLEPVYFDQQRETLDPEKSVMDNVNDGSTHIEVNGRKQHVAGYLKSFMFPPERFHSPVSTLSGGERNRLLLARLLANPSNFMVLDEPTNDLDVESLELLEDMLTRFDGTLILVSHDRAFLDNVVTGIVNVTPTGEVREYVGNYSDFLRTISQEKPAATKQATKPAAAKSTRQQTPAVKLSYKEKREYEELPLRIEAIETEQAKLTEQTQDPAFFSSDHDESTRVLQRLTELADELDSTYARWMELEARA